MTTTADDVWKLLAELIDAQKETEEKFQNLEERIKNIENNIGLFTTIKDTLKEENGDEQFDRFLKKLSKQIRDLPGGYTDGFALESMIEFLYDKFAVQVISSGTRVTKQEEYLEINVLAYNNNAVYVIEVKSHAKEESIDQLKNILGRFHYFFPEHGNKRVYGILTAVDMSADVRKRALQEGLYVARIHDDIFKMDTPKDFHPKAW